MTSVLQKLFISTSLCLTLAMPAYAADGQGYYRTPAIHGDTIVFSSEGDLWKVSTSGGDAHRLTTHAEQELNPAISPDGKWIAYTASYDTAVEAYVMPIDGGTPKQVSFDGASVIVQGWTPDGRVVFTSMNGSTPQGRRVFTVDPVSLDEKELPLADANMATYSGDGNDIYFTRYGLANVGDNAKLYRGGGMSQFWSYDQAKAKEAKRLAPKFGAPILSPMWWNERIYFITDKDGTDNIWVMNTNGRNAKQLTKHEGWDIRSPRLQAGKISYQLGADIHIFDIASNKDTTVDINLVGDMDSRRTRWIAKPLTNLTSANFSAKGDRVALTARGHVAVASPGPLRRVEFNVPDFARARSAVVGAKGKWAYAIIDQGRRGEIWQYPVDGRGEAKQLTNDATAHRWNIYPSPDGKYLFHDDKFARLWMIDLATGENTIVDDLNKRARRGFSDLSWSRDGRYLAYSRPNIRSINQIVILDIETQETHVVSGEKYVSFSPAFSKDGKWLYFLSQTNFRPSPSSPWGDRNMGTDFFDREKIYALDLTGSAEFPFAPANELKVDEEKPKKKEADKKKDAEDKDDDAKKPKVEIKWDGLKDRLFGVPVPAGNYNDLKAGNGMLYVLQNDHSRKSTLKSLKVTGEKPKLVTFASGVFTYSLSGDKKKMFYMVSRNTAAGKMYIVDAGAKAPKDLSKSKLRTSDWKLRINPANEWPQMFLDAWRMHRDWAFDANLRGLDWDAIRAKYEPLVSRVGHRAELNDLLAQMNSELGILHSQIRARDVPTDKEKATAATLGGVYTSHADGLEIKHIYRSEKGLPSLSAPLSSAGVDVQVGDVIAAVNGMKVSAKSELDDALYGQAGQQVILDIKRGDTNHRVVVKAVGKATERTLRYRDWVEGKRDVVSGNTKGNIGYLHLRAMGGNDVESFARDFYEHYDKDGLIIDVRGNNGGNVDSLLIEKLLRRAWAFWYFADNSAARTNMQNTFRGHLVVLIDERTYSDGETFAAGIKALGLGSLVGTQTAGAGIWLSSGNVLADGGIARVAESPQYGMDGRWLLEGRGISPDIEVENMPLATFKGGDSQLDAALKYLKDKIRKEPIPVLKGKPIPRVGTPGKDVQKN